MALLSTIYAVNANLFKDLAQITNSDLIAKSLANALGVDYKDAVDPTKVLVVGYFLRFTDSILSIYILTEGKFLLFEVTKEGDMLTIALPINRIRRVTESFVAGKRQVVVEIAADRATLSLEAGGSALDQFGNTVSLTSGVIRASGYELLALNEDENNRLAYFATALRKIIE